MTRLLLDTGMAADYINRRSGVYQRARERVARGDRLGIGLPVLAELWYGIENSRTRDRNAERLRRVLPDLVVWPLTEKAAEVYGRIATDLTRRGRPIALIIRRAESQLGTSRNRDGNSAAPIDAHIRSDSNCFSIIRFRPSSVGPLC
jgi:tRNA(fMet)-specific endonuclease VapC